MNDELDPVFDHGDVVVLVSGGPPMTVNRIRSGRLECCWFSSDDELNIAELSIYAVRHEEGILSEDSE